MSGILCAASVHAQEITPASPSASVGDPRIDELIARQRRLEQKVAEQDALLRALKERPPVAAEPTAPLAGYGSRSFFLRDRQDWFAIQPHGRINVDWYNFLNRPHPPSGIEPNSAADPRAQLRDTVFLRRARLGVTGTIAKVVDLKLEVEFANLPQPGQYAQVTDASGIINIWPWLRLEAGQFYSPFTLENQTSENSLDFMDRNAVTRWTVPNVRDAGGMLFGEAPYEIVRYYVGLFNGDGQNFKNLDNQPAVVGRVVLAPLGLLPRHAIWLEELWVGGSFWWQRSDNVAGAGPASTTGASVGDLPGFSTVGGFSVFSGNYANGTDAMKNAIRSHLGPNGNTYKYAFELSVPILSRYGLRSEYAHQSIDLREYNDLNPGNGNLTRASGGFARLDGWGAYVEVYAWIGGEIETSRPGHYSVPHWTGYTPPRRPPWAVQLAAKYEHVEWDISNENGAGPAVGHYGIDTFALGANFWVTHHARLMANYVMNYVGMGDPSLAAANEKKNLFFQNLEHELLLRLQVNL